MARIEVKRERPEEVIPQTHFTWVDFTPEFTTRIQKKYEEKYDMQLIPIEGLVCREPRSDFNTRLDKLYRATQLQMNNDYFPVYKTNAPESKNGVLIEPAVQITWEHTGEPDANLLIFCRDQRASEYIYARAKQMVVAKAHYMLKDAGVEPIPADFNKRNRPIYDANA